MWISDIESAVFTRIKANGLKELKKKFPEIFYTTDNETDAEAVFPTVYVEELPGTEQGRDLEGTKINAMLISFQITVSHSGNKPETRAVMDNAITTLKKLRFDIISAPIYKRNGGVWTGTARARRSFGANDIW